ncbi:thiosulfate sulfurtransferase-like [Condylostylus longicornis]|uniref:thiosulfate sulfurtransferase-like n=1 Tax=Condylostylus longicornis TaxID=2530218 RepID=UPI00244E0CC4|nr:thiosulfate sulfurtransferase-like [Condylostylus longicornis]
MPTADHFTGYLASILSDQQNSIDLTKDVFVVYDSIGAWSAPRVWWMLKVFGAANAFILNGGLCGWISEGYEVETTPFRQKSPRSSPEVIGVSFNKALIRTYDAIQRIVRSNSDSCLLIDARPSGRFLGLDPEPRADVASGHIAGSRNVPWKSVLISHRLQRDRGTLSGCLSGNEGELIEYEYFTYNSREKLEELFSEKLNLPPNHDKELIFTCGSGEQVSCNTIPHIIPSGVSAVVVLVATMVSEYCNWDNVSLYDGSWTEWNLREAGKL